METNAFLRTLSQNLIPPLCRLLLDHGGKPETGVTLVLGMNNKAEPGTSAYVYASNVKDWPVFIAGLEQLFIAFDSGIPRALPLSAAVALGLPRTTFARAAAKFIVGALPPNVHFTLLVGTSHLLYASNFERAFTSEMLRDQLMPTFADYAKDAKPRPTSELN